MSAATCRSCPCEARAAACITLNVLAEPEPAEDVRHVLKYLAERLGEDKVEIFPKQERLGEGAVGNWFSLPYLGTTFGGKIHDQFGVKRKGATQSLSEFLELAEERRVTKEKFKELLKAASDTSKNKAKAKGGVVASDAEWYRHAVARLNEYCADSQAGRD